jgi:dihydroxyacetone kinase-like predicted kinase
VPQGITAMLSFDPASAEDVIEAEMSAAIESVHTAQITYAARNSDFDGIDIHEGDYLALLDGKLLGTDRDVSALLDGLSDEAASREAEFITVFYGEDVNEEDAHKACDAFTRKCQDAEVNLICGGQPVYYYMISVE